MGLQIGLAEIDIRYPPHPMNGRVEIRCAFLGCRRCCSSTLAPAVGKLSMVFDKTHEQGLSKDDEYVVVEGASTLFKQKSDVSTASDQPQGQPKRYE